MSDRSSDPATGLRHPRGRRWIALVMALTALAVIGVIMADRHDDASEPGDRTGSVGSEPAAVPPSTAAPAVRP